MVYDFFFIPPYLTLRVGATENWVALVVDAAVMLPVARAVAGMNLARAQARERGLQIRRLFELSTLLVEDRPARPAVEIVGLFLRREADTGTDLGLAIAKTFLDAHGQRIWVDNVPRGGATFCFALAITGLPEEH